MISPIISVPSPLNRLSTIGRYAISDPTMTMIASDAAEVGGALDQRTAADAVRAPVRQRAADLLLERLEQAGRDDEHDRPEDVERRVVGGREALGGDDLEAVRGQAEDDETDADRVRAFGHRQLLGGPDQPLSAFNHEHERLLVAPGHLMSRAGGSVHEWPERPCRAEVSCRPGPTSSSRRSPAWRSSWRSRCRSWALAEPAREVTERARRLRSRRPRRRARAATRRRSTARRPA